jgi:hypothetical protein
MVFATSHWRGDGRPDAFATKTVRKFEIQSGGGKRSPELVAEDERLMDDLYKKICLEDPKRVDYT